MNADDEKPVTKGELKEILSDYPTKAYLHENFPTKKEMWDALGDLEERMAKGVMNTVEASERRLRAEMAQLRTDLRAEIRADIRADMAHMAQVIVEQIGAKIGVVDEKYQDLPPRVDSLERHTGLKPAE
jgi:hypothetical protein